MGRLAIAIVLVYGIYVANGLKLLPFKHRAATKSNFELPRSLPNSNTIYEQKSRTLTAQHAAVSTLFPTVPLVGWQMGVIAAALTSLMFWIRNILWTPSRTYESKENVNSVAREYDAWTNDGILEEYWGEHIHLGYYNEEERKLGYKKKDFLVAKYDFIDEMMKFGGITLDMKPAKILDVGCGIGGTSRYLAKKFGPETQVTGITISPAQQKRATQLAEERDLPNANFEVMDALNMTYPDNSFDVVWACESGEHMPDKARYVNEMTRVLKPGGTIVIATWCERDEGSNPFNAEERKMLDFLYAEWSHPYFISINAYAKIMDATKKLNTIVTADWAKETIPSWWHSIWVGVYNPWPVIRRPHLWYKTFRDGLTIDRMHQAFTAGLMQYGMMTAKKAPYKFEG